MRNIEAVEGVARRKGGKAGVGDVEGHGAPANRDGLGALKGDGDAQGEESRQGGGGSWGGAGSSRATGALPEEVEWTVEAAVGLHS